MSVLTITPGDQIVMDPRDETVLEFDWDDHLAVGAALTSAGTFTVTIEPGYRESSVSLVASNATLVSGNRKVQFKLAGGRAGVLYRVAHYITTNETPANKRERSFLVLVQDR